MIGRVRAFALVMVLAICGGLIGAVPAVVLASEPAGASTIASGGPLTGVTTSPDLNCAVDHTGDTHGEFYGATACGTFAVIGGVMYSPAAIPAGQPGTPWTPVSQVGPTGSGTTESPYRVVTVVDAGATGVRLTQTDTYVVGSESYRTDVAIANTGEAATSVRLYRAGDCYLQDSDSGFGAVEASSGAVACTSAAEGSDRIEQFLPVTPGSAYLESGFATVWSTITAQSAFPNTCVCGSNIDNGAGLSWDVGLAAGATTTISSILTFSPLGIVPLTVTKTADAATTPAGGTNGYTITIHNPNVNAVSLSSIADSLPAGFSYISGSTTGATTADPSIDGSLSWSGPFSVAGDGSVSLHFGVTVSGAAGTYSNNATATAPGYTVVPTGDTAPVTVTSISVLAVTSDGQPATVTAGADATRTVTVSNTGGASATGVSVAMTVPAGVTLVSAAPSQGSCGAVVSGAVTCTLGTVIAGGSANVKFVLQAPAAVPVGGTFSTSATTASSGGGSAGPAVSTTTVAAATPGTATGFIPPGGTLTTGADATTGDNTVSSLTLPNNGPGAVVTITSAPCASGTCLGKTVTWNPFPGYSDPTKPIKVVTIYDKSVAGLGLLQPEFVLKDGKTKYEAILPCSKPGEKKDLALARFLVGLVTGGHTGIASPSPCSDVKEQLGNGDLRYTTLFLSGDPSKRR